MTTKSWLVATLASSLLALVLPPASVATKFRADADRQGFQTILKFRGAELKACTTPQLDTVQVLTWLENDRQRGNVSATRWKKIGHTWIREPSKKTVVRPGEQTGILLSILLPGEAPRVRWQITAVGTRSAKIALTEASITTPCARADPG